MAEEAVLKPKYFRVSQIKDQAFAAKNAMSNKGYSTGFKCLDNLISYKEGYSTIIFSYAHQGKTQFAVEEAIWLAKKHGLVSMIYLTEAGSMAETILDICQSYLGKNFSTEYVSDDDLLDAMDWMNKYFILLNCEDNLLTIREIFTALKDAQKEFGIVIKNLVIDHYGNIEKDEKQKYFNTADNVKYVLQAVTRTSKKFGIHTFILFHVRDTDPIQCPITKMFYMPEPEMQFISGGQQSNFLGQQIISVWRAVSSERKFGIIDPNTAMPFLLNETRITVHKSKPKFIGFLGTQSIYFSKQRQSFYEEDDQYGQCFAGEYEAQIGELRPQAKQLRHFQDPEDAEESIFTSAIKPSAGFMDVVIKPSRFDDESAYPPF